jgi:hypothetical protein
MVQSRHLPGWKPPRTSVKIAGVPREIRTQYFLHSTILAPDCYTSLFDSFFIHQWLYSPLLCPGLFFIFVIFFTQTVGLLGRVINQSQGRYLYTAQHKHRINAHINIHALEWDSNPRSQRSSERRQFMPKTVRPP